MSSDNLGKKGVSLLNIWHIHVLLLHKGKDVSDNTHFLCVVREVLSWDQCGKGTNMERIFFRRGPWVYIEEYSS